MTRQQMIEHMQFIIRHLQAAIDELSNPDSLDPPCLDDVDATLAELYDAIEEGNIRL
jgi:hypothetical protein